MLPPLDTSFERTRIGNDILLVLIHMAIKGPSVLVERLDPLIPIWSDLLHLDDSGPASCAQIKPSPVIPKVNIENAAHNHRPTSRSPKTMQMETQRKAKDEITRIMIAKNYTVRDVNDFVKQVGARLSEAISETNIEQKRRSPQPSTANGELAQDAPDMPVVGPVLQNREDESALVARPAAHKINRSFQHGVYLKLERRLKIDLVSSFQRAVLDLPKWIPHDNDCRFSPYSQSMDVFAPEVSQTSNRRIVFPDVKVRLQFDWPSTKVNTFCYFDEVFIFQVCD